MTIHLEISLVAADSLHLDELGFDPDEESSFPSMIGKKYTENA